MIFPVNFWDISLLFAITAIILLITSVMLSSYHGESTILVNKTRLRNIALIVSALFLITIAIRITDIILSQ
ncbi:MAG: hypothetical protein NWE94_05805 [Candidatus Bathyarchaeota archaeon]|nr:hypothetical protein [Candidatus Bathyarchaeota archaeon]